MKRKIPIRAFENFEFMHSDEARPIRILSEYIYPMHIFSQEKITDTVVVFGSARYPSPEQKVTGPLAQFSKYYEASYEIAAGITRWSTEKASPLGRNFLICTGGGPGAMEAANRGAKEAGGKSIGLNIELMHEQEANPYISPELSFDFHYFFTRKFWFLYHSRALIIFPGGFGTMDELFETLTLQQTNAIDNKIPVFLYGKDFWSKAINFQYLSECGLISPEDLHLFKIVDSVEEALGSILPVLEECIKNGG